MKKLLLFTAISVVLFAGCKPSSYKIEGAISDKTHEGDFIYIKERINRVWTSIDSVQIKDGKFTFTGECDSARVVYIFLENENGETLREPFVFENGAIKLTIDSSACTIGGTEQNDKLQTYMSARKTLYDDAEKAYKAFNDSLASDAEKAAFEQKMKNFEAKITENDIKFSCDYVNSIVGNFIFGSSYYSMTVEQKEKVVSLMNAETKASERIAEIISNIEIEKKTAVGQKYTDIKLAGLDGAEVALSSLIGKTDYVLVDFWASWCGPCMQSLPELKTLYAKYGGSKLEIFGVSLDDNLNNWKGTINAKGINWKHVSDLQGWKSAGAALYAVKSIPATVLIDKTGTIVGRNLLPSEIEKTLKTSN